MKRNLVRLLIGAILVVAIPVAVPSAASAQDFEADCAPMTHSITRLYSAFFDGRTPDDGGFALWVDAYRSGRLTLEEIADEFANGEEFAQKELRSNEAFVTWIYRSLFDQEPDSNFDTWVAALDDGVSRGEVMINFTEGEAYVLRTGTAKPLAGYYKTYPKGTHWYCNVGADTIRVKPLTLENGELWADYYFQNRGGNDEQIALWTLDEDLRGNAEMAGGTLRAGFTDYNWHGVFRGDGNYGDFISVQAGSSTRWIVVFYPTDIGERRWGWEL